MICWVDLETTGLDPRTGSILEIAMIATDDNLVQIGEPFVSIVKPLHMRGWEAMGDFVKAMHMQSGLVAQLYHVEALLSKDDPSACVLPDVPRLGDVERAAIKWLETLFAPCNCIGDQGEAAAGLHNRACSVFNDWKKKTRGTPLGGNTVHFDKRWLIEHMDELEALFSHRIYDVSSFTEEVKRSAPEVYKRRPGLDATGKPIPAHRALDDIKSSIETAKFYRGCARWSSDPYIPVGP